ncbi:MAG TPA: hypothetical protein VHC67_16475 [Gaiellaceae bacterium]|nr:hypothetical protein [Gaiellaceae bacterium]
MRRWRTRAFAIVGLGAGAAAGLAAVLAALAAPPDTLSQAKAADATITYHSVSFGHDRVAVERRPGGRLCFTVNRGNSTAARSCAGAVGATEIHYASSRTAIGGLAGSSVRAVIVRLTKKGTVWATLRDGAFFAAVPKNHRVRAVVKVLAGGRRQTFTV